MGATECSTYRTARGRLRCGHREFERGVLNGYCPGRVSKKKATIHGINESLARWKAQRQRQGRPVTDEEVHGVRQSVLHLRFGGTSARHNILYKWLDSLPEGTLDPFQMTYFRGQQEEDTSCRQTLRAGSARGDRCRKPATRCPVCSHWYCNLYGHMKPLMNQHTKDHNALEQKLIRNQEKEKKRKAKDDLSGAKKRRRKQ